MVSETLARRYALAVFSLAKEAAVIERAGNDLSSMARSIESDSKVREFFVSPVIDRKDKERILVAAFGGRFHDIALHTVLLLVRKRRETLLGALIAEYRKLELLERGAEALTVTTAHALSEADLRATVERLEQTYGKKFEVSVRHDPSLIGGLRIMMGDRRIDGTVAGRLDELTRTLFAHN
jgi:F-type H+-transporting ATPase subunit delta